MLQSNLRNLVSRGLLRGSPGLGYVAFEKIHKECDTLKKTLALGLHKVGEVGHFEELTRFVSKPLKIIVDLCACTPARIPGYSRKFSFH